MVYGMSHHPHSVVLQRNIYIGGGLADNASDECTILMYNMEHDTWCCLPKYRYRRFAMTVINRCLTVVGGIDASPGKATNQLAVFDHTSQNWTYPYPPMPTPRFDTAVSTYDIWLLVAGGYHGGDLATVELLNTSTALWLSTAPPLPMPCSYMTSATDQDNWYFVTANKQVFHVSLPVYVTRTLSKSTASKSPAIWCRLPDTTLKQSTAIALCGSLLAVGGCHDNLSSTAIHLYQLESKKWTKVGDLPTALDDCFCILLPSGKLLVGGGSSGGYYSSQVYEAAVLD